MDLPRQPQLVLQEASHLFRLDHVTEHPDLRPLPLDVGVARWQPGAPDGPADGPPHLRGEGDDDRADAGQEIQLIKRIVSDSVSSSLSLTVQSEEPRHIPTKRCRLLRFTCHILQSTSCLTGP